MKYLLLPLLLLPLLLFGPFGASPHSPAPAAAHNWSRIDHAPAPETETPEAETDAATLPVVLELFTSQGCSSCPSADRVLLDLAQDDDVIALSFHVDYWNYLGWEDPFSSSRYSARQRDYTGQLHARTYTPQLVVNGREELVGSRAKEVKALVETARQTQAGYTPEITVDEQTPGEVTVNYRLPGKLEGLRVSAVLVQNKETSAVKRGENRGRELHHANVVRALQHRPARARGAVTLDVPEGFRPSEGQVVLLVQRTGDQVILGATRRHLSAR